MNKPPTSLSGNNAGQALAYVYFEEEPGRRSAAKLLARAANIARLPDLLLGMESSGRS
jgi:hypothetical protein